MTRKMLSLSERVEAIRLHDVGKCSPEVVQIMEIEEYKSSKVLNY